ncbi:hypothetical protein [Synechococcus sp. 7002]|uniref:hypothetical protein n=1 Tax=Synechococcus sp. 7002 TaxID=1938862 RepID=UPI000A2AE3BB|nr:hypothetical protein SAMN06272774_0218 [Synechococcus sp. 7002]
MRLDAAGKKDPRSTIIEIVRPGSAKETDATSEKVTPVENLEPQQLQIETPETGEVAPEADDTAPQTAQPVETKVSPQAEPEAAEKDAEEKTNGRRRRRRRSSASS